MLSQQQISAISLDPIGDGQPISIFSLFIVYLVGFGGIPNSTFDVTWKSTIALKIKVFLLLVQQNKIHTKVNLFKKGWLGCTACLLFGQPKTTTHLFVNFTQHKVSRASLETIQLVTPRQDVSLDSVYLRMDS